MHKVLCVGTPIELRDSRKLVLESVGYSVTLVEAVEPIDVLLSETFDLLLLSVTLSEPQRAALREAAPEHTRIIQLEAFTEPQQLLTLMRRQTDSSTRLQKTQ